MEKSCGCRTGTPVVIRATSTPAFLKRDAKLSRKLLRVGDPEPFRRRQRTTVVVRRDAVRRFTVASSPSQALAGRPYRPPLATVPPAPVDYEDRPTWSNSLRQEVHGADRSRQVKTIPSLSRRVRRKKGKSIRRAWPSPGTPRKTAAEIELRDQACGRDGSDVSVGSWRALATAMNFSAPPLTPRSGWRRRAVALASRDVRYFADHLIFPALSRRRPISASSPSGIGSSVPVGDDGRRRGFSESSRGSK